MSDASVESSRTAGRAALERRVADLEAARSAKEARVKEILVGQEVEGLGEDEEGLGEEMRDYAANLACTRRFAAFHALRRVSRGIVVVREQVYPGIPRFESPATGDGHFPSGQSVMILPSAGRTPARWGIAPRAAGSWIRALTENVRHEEIPYQAALVDPAPPTVVPRFAVAPSLDAAAQAPAGAWFITWRWKTVVVDLTLIGGPNHGTMVGVHSAVSNLLHRLQTEQFVVVVGPEGLAALDAQSCVELLLLFSPPAGGDDATARLRGELQAAPAGELRELLRPFCVA